MLPEPSNAHLQVRVTASAAELLEVIVSNKRHIEVFSAGCAVCRETIDLVNRLACPSGEISVLDMNDKETASRAAELGVRSVPAVIVDGTLADCCTGRGVDENRLRAAGIGQSLA